MSIPVMYGYAVQALVYLVFAYLRQRRFCAVLKQAAAVVAQVEKERDEALALVRLLENEVRLLREPGGPQAPWRVRPSA